MGDKLTPKQAAFVREYLVDRNGTQAAIRAGYSKKTANITASKLLTKANIKDAVDKGEEKHAERCAVTIETITQELESDRQLARDLSQPSAAITASMGIAKLHGLVIDKAENKNTNTNAEASDKIMTPQEWEAQWKQQHQPHH